MNHLAQQKAQHEHDTTRGDGTWERGKPERMKAYGLRLSRIVGRMSGLREGGMEMQELAGEAYCVALSSANMLGLDLDRELAEGRGTAAETSLFLGLADEAGRYADAAEKLDHLEEFVSLLKDANAGVVRVLEAACGDRLAGLAETARSVGVPAAASRAAFG